MIGEPPVIYEWLYAPPEMPLYNVGKNGPAPMGCRGVTVALFWGAVYVLILSLIHI